MKDNVNPTQNHTSGEIMEEKIPFTFFDSYERSDPSSFNGTNVRNSFRTDKNTKELQ
jgi:hypothetical protein